jgi:hypothetical protein
MEIFAERLSSDIKPEALAGMYKDERRLGHTCDTIVGNADNEFQGTE